MSHIDDKRDKFASFYLIQHAVPLNIKPLAEGRNEMDQVSFEAQMPYAFRIAVEMSELESQALRPFRSMGEKFEELVDYLKLQARKMDLMMSYILQQQDEAAFRHSSFRFGGGGASVLSEQAVDLGTPVEIKLFLEDEAAAVYTFAEVVNCEAKDDKYLVDYYFTHIREQDQELLVRASLHLQTKLLRQAKN